MSYASENGYTPVSMNDIMEFIRVGVNAEFGTTFTPTTWVGSNWYKYFYVLTQRVLENETKTAEIFAKLQEYISLTNERIQRPSVSLPGLLDSFEANGYVASVKRNLIGDAGTISIAVDVDDDDPNYEATKLEINGLIRDFVVAGMVYIGDQESELTLSNGQQFDFAFSLPTRTPIILRATIDPSDNQQVTLPSDIEIRTAIFNNINSRYRLGWDFEPQRYYTQADAPWAADILLEYSYDEGENWVSVVYQATYTDLFTFGLGDITVVIT